MGAVQACANSVLSGNLVSEWLNSNANQKIFEDLKRKSNPWVYLCGCLEVLGLSLHRLLVNPTLSVHNLRVTTHKQIWQCSVFRTTLLFVMKQKQDALLVYQKRKFCLHKEFKTLILAIPTTKTVDFALLFIWKTNAMSLARVIQQATAYWLSTTAHSNSTASW